jgi:hypothetical protein
MACLVAAVVAYLALLQAFHLLNQPSDRALYSGLAIIFGLLLLIPIIVREIWRKL